MKLSDLLEGNCESESMVALENMGIKLFEFSEYSESSGLLSYVEFAQILDFQIKRYFFVSKMPVNTLRGNHAHRLCFQLIHCIGPQIELELDNLKNKITVTLDSTKGLILIPPKIWVTFKSLNHNAILAVFASEAYDESDYIRDYRVFMKENEIND
jgi:dTDP-4-dehydrorhamnose 3,5-epimerase-like enzyme